MAPAAVAQLSLGCSSTANDSAASTTRSAMSAAAMAVKRPNIAKATPEVPTNTSSVSHTCGQPGSVTISERVKIANVIRVMGAQILRASYMVRMNEASAMRAETAAVSEVGGDSSPQTESRNT